MIEEEEQLSFEQLWSDAIKQSSPSKPLPAKQARVKKRKSKSKKTPEYLVRLVHENGVDWRLDCFQKGESDLDDSYYDHLAAEALKLELLRMLKQDSPEVMEVYMVSLVLAQLRVDLPNYLHIDANKNLLECDFWTGLESVERKHYHRKNSSFLWAFYFKEFADNACIAQRVFSEFPAEELDLSFLSDYSSALENFPGLRAFPPAE